MVEKGWKEGRVANEIIFREKYERIVGWKEDKRLKCDCCRVSSVRQLHTCEVKGMKKVDVVSQCWCSHCFCFSGKANSEGWQKKDRKLGPRRAKSKLQKEIGSSQKTTQRRNLGQDRQLDGEKTWTQSFVSAKEPLIYPYGVRNRIQDIAPQPLIESC